MPLHGHQALEENQTGDENSDLQKSFQGTTRLRRAHLCRQMSTLDAVFWGRINEKLCCPLGDIYSFTHLTLEGMGKKFPPAQRERFLLHSESGFLLHSESYFSCTMTMARARQALTCWT